MQKFLSLCAFIPQVSISWWDSRTNFGNQLSRCFSPDTLNNKPNESIFALHRLMNVLMDDLRTYKELPVKNCGECRFSNGGQAFAAVMGSVIVIYSFYTCEVIHTVRGHNGLVRLLLFATSGLSPLFICACFSIIGAVGVLDFGRQRSDHGWYGWCCVREKTRRRSPSTGVGAEELSLHLVCLQAAALSFTLDL